MSEFKSSTKLPTRIKGQTARSGRKLNLSSDQKVEKRIEGKAGQEIAVQKDGRVGKVQSNAAGKGLSGKVYKRRTGPKGKLAIVSDGAVDSISKDMEKRTRIAIRKIGRSTGF